MLLKPMPRKYKKECKLICTRIPMDGDDGEKSFLKEYQKAVDEGYKIVGSPFCMNSTIYALMEKIKYKED